MPLFDFKCRVCGVIEEHLIPRRVETLPCTACGSVCDVQASAPAAISILGYSSFNGYSKIHEESRVGGMKVTVDSK